MSRLSKEDQELAQKLAEALIKSEPKKNSADTLMDYRPAEVSEDTYIQALKALQVADAQEVVDPESADQKLQNMQWVLDTYPFLVNDKIVSKVIQILRTTSDINKLFNE